MPNQNAAALPKVMYATMTERATWEGGRGGEESGDKMGCSNNYCLEVLMQDLPSTGF
jgi:hypothetical protein